MAKKKTLKQRATAQKKKYSGGNHGKKYHDPNEKGRKKDVPNLIKLDDGSVQNQYGVVFSEAEKKRLVSLVNRASKIRRDMLNAESKLPRMEGGHETGDTVGSLHAMGKESDFIIARKTKSLQRYKTKEQYENYIANLENVIRPEYVDERTRLYKRNHLKAIKDNFGQEGMDIYMKIRMMPIHEYRKLLQQDEVLEISYIYDPVKKKIKMDNIRRALGMRLPDDSIGTKKSTKKKKK